MSCKKDMRKERCNLMEDGRKEAGCERREENSTRMADAYKARVTFSCDARLTASFAFNLSGKVTSLY